MLKHFFFGIFFLTVLSGFSQEETLSQTIRGSVLDEQSGYPLHGVVVAITTTSPQKGTITDENGEFSIEDVPVGRHTVIFQYNGYDKIIRQNVLLTSGKQLVLNVRMVELVKTQEEITLTLEEEAGKVNNENTSVSARTFSIEETSRYASSRNDPARMAQNFAGVSQGNDSRNDIIIRGNSPLGVQWRMDGIVMPNPNHFGAFGTSGGPVNIINNNTLANSDFLTGAFPAEYGNVLAGVFDLNMRKGNIGKFEGMGQIGFNGVELGLEGPFKKDGSSSFMANYRYSTIELFDLVGISFGTVAIPEYQDLSFKMNFPTKKAGEFSVFGIGGVSKIELLGSELNVDDLFSERSEDVIFETGTGIVGLTHNYFLNEKASFKSKVAVSGIRNLIIFDSLTYDTNDELLAKTPSYRNHFSQTKYTMSTEYKKKINSSDTWLVGYILDFYDFNLVDSSLSNNGIDFIPITNSTGGTALGQLYTHWQHKFSDNTILNSGLHYQLLTLNKSAVIEPRLGVKFNLKENQSINVGASMHSQIQPFQIYYLEDQLSPGVYERTNLDLDYTKALHFIVGYDRQIASNMRFKSEAYYQYIYNAPVESVSSSFSLLNAGADFGITTRDNLVNNGTARNYGIELTLEKFFSDNYYFLSTLSLYDSKYKGSDGELRNTAFNGAYVFNLLAGKEFNLSNKSTLVVDLKSTFAGGKRVTPLDVAQSQLENQTVLDDSKAFSKILAPYFRPDIKIAFRLNGKKATQEWALDIQNVIARKNVFNIEYDKSTSEERINYQLGFFPVVQYRILF